MKLLNMRLLNMQRLNIQLLNMRLRNIAVAALVAPMAVLVLDSAQSRAQAQADPYRWCAQYSGRGGPTNCYFMTIGQCQAAVSGVGGFCRPNPFYTGGGEPRRKVRRSY
jgi:hypothetical protein